MREKLWWKYLEEANPAWPTHRPPLLLLSGHRRTGGGHRVSGVLGGVTETRKHIHTVCSRYPHIFLIYILGVWPIIGSDIHNLFCMIWLPIKWKINCMRSLRQNALLAGGSDAVASLWLYVPPAALLDWLYITGRGERGWLSHFLLLFESLKNGILYRFPFNV